MVLQFDGDTNNGNTYQCDLSDTDAFIGNTSITGVPAGSDDRVLATLTDGGLESYADEVDTIYLRGKFSSGDDAEITISCWGWVWE